MSDTLLTYLARQFSNFETMVLDPKRRGYPDYAEVEKNRVLAQLENLYNINNPIVIGFSTDQHLADTKKAMEDNIIPNLRTMATLTKEFPFDLIVLGGDSTSTVTDIATLNTEVQKVTDAVNDSHCPVFHLIGNHDGYLNIPDISASAVFNAHRTFPIKNKSAVTVDESTNCYYDDIAHQIRYIMLCSEALRGYSYEQTRAFLSSALSSLPNGYETIIFSHRPLGNLTDNTSTRVDDWNEPLGWGDIVNPYADKIIACISGHVHTDKYEIKDGILYLATTCAGWLELNDGTTREDKKGTAQCTAYDVMVIDRDTHTIHCIRYGIGNNRDIIYRPISYTNVIPTSIDTDNSVYNEVGYKRDVRLNSSGGETAEHNSGVTGYISVAPNDVIYLKNCNLWGLANTSTEYQSRIAFYDANFNLILVMPPRSWENTDDASNHLNLVLNDANYVTSFTVPNHPSWKYMRICAQGIDGNSIITINEPIV